MNRRERRNKKRKEKRVLAKAARRFANTLTRPCASCGAEPNWQIVRRESDVWYQCASCGEDAFRIPFHTEWQAAEFMKNALKVEAEAAAS